MRVRAARDTDVIAIAQLARELADHVADPDPGEDTSDLLDLGFGDGRWFDCIVAEIGSEIIGFALYCKRFEAHTRSRKLWLGDLVITKQHRSRGVGEMLVDALRQKAIALGCDGIMLELWVDNPAARDFYAKMGAELNAELKVFLIPAKVG